MRNSNAESVHELDRCSLLVLFTEIVRAHCCGEVLALAHGQVPPWERILQDFMLPRLITEIMMGRATQIAEVPWLCTWRSCWSLLRCLRLVLRPYTRGPAFRSTPKPTRDQLETEGEHPVFASWNAAETQKNRFDQKFDFEERGYFGNNSFPNKNNLKWAET